MKWITVSEYQNTMLSKIDQDQLSMNDIKSIVEFENLGTIPEITGNFLGGILLKVQEKDLKEALEILKKQEINQLENDIHSFEQNSGYIKENVKNKEEISIQTNIVFEFFLYICIPTFVGYYIDEYLHSTSYFGTIIGATIGFGTGIYKLILFGSKKKN